MIFVTVGGQMPFNRLVRSVDEWAGTHKNIEFFAQIGRGGWKPEHIAWAELLSPPTFRHKILSADLIIAHAGMGTILNALDLSKRLSVMPRRGYLRETRNDHQVATANRLESMGLVVQAHDERELTKHLEDIDSITPKKSLSPNASQQLLDALTSFISVNKSKQ